MILVQIVTGLPPLTDGIGDYALQLARQLRERHGILTSFVVGNPAWNGGAAGSTVEGFPSRPIASQTKQDLLAGLSAACAAFPREKVKLLLHFQPYGYAKRGCPLWLADAMEEWDQREPGTLNIVFHELRVTRAWPWSSGFWVSPFQKWIATRTSKLGVFRYANTEENRSSLERWGSGRISLLFNCSTIAEPLTNPPFAARRKDIIIFGRADQRRLAYERGGEALASLCVSLGAERIIDIGSPISRLTVTDIAGVPIYRCGRLEAKEISEWMSRSVASFQAYSIPSLGKSTIYSASCSHGTIPYIFDDQRTAHSCPGLQVGQDYIAIPSSKSDPPPLPHDVLSQRVFDGYQTRKSSVLADQVAKAIQGMPR